MTFLSSRLGLAVRETRKWRRISLKTLETELEMAGPTPSLTRDHDEVLVTAARLGSDDRLMLQFLAPNALI